jgi:hypothetical protein
MVSFSILDIGYPILDMRFDEKKIDLRFETNQKNLTNLFPSNRTGAGIGFSDCY